ncbi:MAG: hypothetical protein VX603_01245 [Gemmatimonadota bacterium]|nr:hypothetical protein [Gemmatimonadota bacterium]
MTPQETLQSTIRHHARYSLGAHVLRGGIDFAIFRNMPGRFTSSYLLQELKNPA